MVDIPTIGRACFLLRNRGANARFQRAGKKELYAFAGGASATVDSDVRYRNVNVSCK